MQITTIGLDISGLQVCKAARALAGSRRALYIMVMSSTEDYGVAIQALDNGADDFIRKPPFPEELKARLRAADRLTTMQRDLITLATTDSLTRLLNRRAFFDHASEACRAAQFGKALSAIIFDIDHFKEVNDTYGHEVGDAVLASISKAVKTAAMLAGRLGGEEFCLLEHCGLADATETAGRLRGSIASMRFGAGSGFGITASFGVGELEDGDTIDRLLRRADIALYAAKMAGRNRAVASDTFTLKDQHEKWRGVARVHNRSLKIVN